MTKRFPPSIDTIDRSMLRTARAGSLRLAGALCAALLLPACGTIEWVKTRFVEPTASAPAPSQSEASAQRAAPAPAPKAEPPAPPPVAQPSPPPPAPPIAQGAPAQRAPLPPVTQAAPAPVQQPPAAPRAPAPRAAPAPAASGDLAAGHWAVQVGVFYGAGSAEAVRARVAARLAQSGLVSESHATRIVKRDNKYFVVVGDAADQGSAQALASQVRAALKQDVALFRR